MSHVGVMVSIKDWIDTSVHISPFPAVLHQIMFINQNVDSPGTSRTSPISRMFNKDYAVKGFFKDSSEPKIASTKDIRESAQQHLKPQELVLTTMNLYINGRLILWGKKLHYINRDQILGIK